MTSIAIIHIGKLIPNSCGNTDTDGSMEPPYAETSRPTTINKSRIVIMTRVNFLTGLIFMTVDITTVIYVILQSIFSFLDPTVMSILTA